MEQDNIEEVMDLEVSPETVRMSVIGVSLEEDYGPLTVSTGHSMSGQMKYEFEFPETEFEIHFKAAEENYQLYLMEALSRGFDYDRAVEEIYTVDKAFRMNNYEDILPVINQKGKLFKDYREPLGDAMDDLFWD